MSVVFYDPEKPSESALTPASGDMAMTVALFNGAILGVSVFFQKRLFGSRVKHRVA